VSTPSNLPVPARTDADRPVSEDWAAVAVVIRERMGELGVSTAQLARDTGLSETTIRSIGRPGRGHRKHALVAIAAALRWRHDHLVNILHGQPEKNTAVRTSERAGLERLLHAEVSLLKDDLSHLRETVYATSDKASSSRQDGDRSPHAHRPRPEAISDLPMPGDMDADYSPQYVKLARILRDKITSGQYKHGDSLPADKLASEHGVSVRVAWKAMEMLAANRYVHRPGRFISYAVTWQADA
jgi:hypothetical protein